MSGHKKSLVKGNECGGSERSKNAEVNKHLSIGSSVVTNEPVLIAKSGKDIQCWVTGGTGAGKTALTLAPMVSQEEERRE